uniref:peptidylprolyl isomerase n=1 Tax=Paulinella chromatophora TaxID=39717 RepID=B1X4J1_PAUCH|nr:putative cyclophilin-type peptidyl-prolyl cis- trans isomerase [Paulinella chromatophora]ACB42860.1 putative cyclophilin-type peptidyl-prolyl cis- trans isomerase [Paulinella chromatophora]
MYGCAKVQIEVQLLMQAYADQCSPVWSMKHARTLLGTIYNYILHTALCSLIFLGISLTTVNKACAGLPPGNAVTDPTALLRDALPINQTDLQEIQHRLESTSDDVRAKRWKALSKSVKRTQSMLAKRQASIINSLPELEREKGSKLIDQLVKNIEELTTAADNENREAFLGSRRSALACIGNLETLLVNEFPFQIPEEFNGLPRLLGRATLQINTNKGDLIAVVDGYNAPLTAGAFVDLAQKRFYDGLPFTRAEDFYVLQTGDPKGPNEGFIDPKTKVTRNVPLEIKIPGEESPFYNQTFEDLGLFKATPVLPFATKGTLGWAHSDSALDDGSSQFFLFLFEPELTPAGLNLIDGRYAAFGYVVDGFDVLEELTGDDMINSIEVLEGAEHLEPHG